MTQAATPSLSRSAEAVLRAAVLAARADQNVQESELSRIRAMMFLSPIFAEVKLVDETILSVWRGDWGKNEGEVLAEIAAALPETLRPTAYAWAAEITLANGRVVDEEHSFLSRLREELGLHGELAGKIKAVSEIRLRRE